MFGVTEDFKVIKTDPGDGRSNVALNSEIKVYFSQAVDAATLHTGTFVVQRNSATPIAGSVRYEVTPRGEFVGVFKPSVVLHPETTYQVTLVGLSHPVTGGTASVIKSFAGVTLGRNVTFVFSTGAVSVQPPVPESPVEYSSVTDTKPKLQWALIAGATNYEIEIGTSELMDPLYIPPGSSISYPVVVPGDQDNYVPADDFERGIQYFWRIRTYQNGTFSAWSSIHSFRILQPDEDRPYIPGSDVPYQPTGDSNMLFSGTEAFRVLGVEPVNGAMDQDPEYFRVFFNKAIDEDSLDLDTFICNIKGSKVVSSDPNTSDPGIIEIEEAYVDEEDATILIIVPVGGAAPE